MCNLFWLCYPSNPLQIEARNLEALLLAQEAYEELVASVNEDRIRRRAELNEYLMLKKVWGMFLGRGQGGGWLNNYNCQTLSKVWGVCALGGLKFG